MRASRRDYTIHGLNGTAKLDRAVTERAVDLPPKRTVIYSGGKRYVAYDAHQLLESISETPRPGKFYE